MKSSWIRVTTKDRCPICNHYKGCMVAPDGGAVICVKIASNKQAGGAGWLHRIGSAKRSFTPKTYTIPAATGEVKTYGEEAENFHRVALDHNRLSELAERLKVCEASLRRLGVGYCEKGSFWTFPLCSAEGEVVGINRRFRNAEKKIMKGHKAGLYLPADDFEDKEPQAAALVRLAEDDELFRDPSGEMALAAVTVGKGEDRRTEIHPIGSKGYRTSLARRFYQKTKRPPNAQAMQDAIQILTGEAIFEGPTRPTAVRVAMHEGAQYIDLADDRRRVIRITPSGAAILDSQIPVAFLRKRGMQALPCPDLSAEPEALDELRALINASNDQHWRLMLAYLIASLRPVGPYVILGVNGEQGSAKSTACRLIRRSIDPNESDLRGSPRDERDLIIAAMNSWICGYDNLSSISLQMSDALCRVSTGAGFATRELFTDEGEKIFAVCRPQLLNGIGDVLDQSDLLDRAIIVTLDRISDERRRTEADIWREFERIRPRVFGALINATSLAMKRENEITLAWAPRMIDAARWIAAAEPALPVPAGSLLEAYRQNRAEAAEIALEASAVAAGVIELVNRRIGFDGSVGELLNVLNEICDLNLKRRPDWPRNPKGLGNKLRRVAPVLRRHGIEVSDRGRGKHGYQITICGTSPNRNSSCSPSSPDPVALSKENEDGEHGELLPSKCITESPRRKQVEV